MEIITSLKALDIDEFCLRAIQAGTADMDEIRRMIFEKIESSFDDAVNTCDVYLSRHYEENDFVFGAVKPSILKEISSNWNTKIKQQFLDALNKVVPKKMNPEELPMNTLETYNLWAAARELDNCWWHDTNHAVYLLNWYGYPYFRVTLDEAMEEDILNHPENYIVFEVTVRT